MFTFTEIVAKRVIKVKYQVHCILQKFRAIYFTICKKIKLRTVHETTKTFT
jgi:hypothetical protein